MKYTMSKPEIDSVTGSISIDFIAKDPKMHINYAWQHEIEDILEHGEVSEPRGMPIKEVIGSQLVFGMDTPIITLKSREVNFKFAFGEAWWILSGSNEVEGPRGITQFMKNYKRFSDDGVFMQGAYGPKFVDQLTWVVNALEADQDTRQAVISFWRERPAGSKDIPCTLNQQYFIRDGKLHVVATMRSNDLIWGTTYDTFTFTMMARMVQTLLRGRGINVEMGYMYLNQGSAHIYKDFWEKAEGYTDVDARNEDNIDPVWNNIGYDPKRTFESRQELLDYLYETATSL